MKTKEEIEAAMVTLAQSGALLHRADKRAGRPGAALLSAYKTLRWVLEGDKSFDEFLKDLRAAMSEQEHAHTE